MSTPFTADQLRSSFLDFFAARGHRVVPSASLIPHDPSVLFTVAGMVPFKPYFVGDETPPSPRATSSQKCARAGGKHNDLDDVGRTKRHLVFFEMLGNFSFGDYFKSEIIPWSWELTTEVFGLDGDRLWITVHDTDDEAEAMWHEVVGVPMERIQRLGDHDNFWQMGDTGPCGPCSEIHIDRGPAFGPDGGPRHDPTGDRYMEFWNLVFMQYDQAADGTRAPLPKPSIDTGLGLERMLCLLQGVDAVWETDLMLPLIETGCSLTGATYTPGDYEDRTSFSIRVLAEHARSAAMLISDGVFPSNEGRGYVLRRIIRRAVRHAYLLGTSKVVMPDLAATAIEVMAGAYPDVAKNADFIQGVLQREEERFRLTLKTGLGILSTELADSPEVLGGATVFALHDTYGFPLELTEEIAGEQGVRVDREGFDEHMAQQRRRAKAAQADRGGDEERQQHYREIAETAGQTDFVGYTEVSSEATVVAVLPGADDTVEIFLDRTPFYAESGGQVGDTGEIVGPGGRATVLDTTFALPGLRRHLARIDGEIVAGDRVRATIDDARRSAIRRNHTATHLLHHALRNVLGDHVKQAGSLVSADRLRFDFSHYSALTDEEIARVEAEANAAVLANPRARVYETTKQEALELGAIAFFGDKYGDIVRVMEVGDSVELCGGTHVHAAGDIGLIKIVAESSIGSNLRRIEAVTGMNSLRLLQRDEHIVTEVAHLVGSAGDDVLDGVQRRLEEIRSLNDQVRELRARLAGDRARDLAQRESDGRVIERVDGLSPDALRELAIAVRAQPDVDLAVLVGISDSGGVSLVSAVRPGSGYAAGALIKDAARAVGGGGGGKGDVATAGGKNPDGIDDALRIVAEAARG